MTFQLDLFQDIQIALVAVMALVSILLSRFIWKRLVIERFKKTSDLFKRTIRPLITYSFFIIFLLLVSLIFYSTTNQLTVFNALFQFSLFVLVGHYVYVLTKSKLLYATTLVGLGGLWHANRLDLLKPVFDYLNSYSLKLGAIQITPWGFLKSIVTILAFLWVTSIISHQFRRRVKKIRTIKAGTKEILAKSFDIFIYLVAGLLVLNVLGINLSTFTVIGGALGVGIGFGLQKITSNFISGLILLFEKSIKLDDLVELDGGIYGFIRRLGSRYTLIETFDGKEILVPNEDFITNRVTNWTYSNKSGRIEIKVGVSYKSDIKKVQSLMLEAAREYPQCLDDPPPKCFLKEFGDSSVNFILFFFIGDVTVGHWEPRSKVMMAIWDKFEANQIEIPFPQRDIHIKTEG